LLVCGCYIISMKEVTDERRKLRLFTGLYLTQEVRRQVADITTVLSEDIEGVRWVPQENLHVTLKFLGWCDRAVIKNLAEIMTKAADYLPLTLTVGGVGAFPSLGSARVIWVGASDIEGRVEKVYNVLDKGAAKCGIPKEKRAYRPHITIGRARKRPVMIGPEIAGRFDGEKTLEIVDIVLFSSELKSTGAEYTVLERIGRANTKEQL
jgi:2'-5' RNA ligase